MRAACLAALVAAARVNACADDPTFTDQYGYTCNDWGYASFGGVPDCAATSSTYIVSCPTGSSGGTSGAGPASFPAGPDASGQMCEPGGFYSGGYWTAAEATQIRNACPVACNAPCPPSWYGTPPPAAVDVASAALLVPRIAVLNADVAIACGVNRRVPAFNPSGYRSGAGYMRMVQCVGIKLGNGPTTAYASSIINITSVRPYKNDAYVPGGHYGYSEYRGMEITKAADLSIVRMSDTSAVVCNDELLCDTDRRYPAPNISASRRTDYCPPEWVGYIYSDNYQTNAFPGPHTGDDRCKALVWNAATSSLSMGPAISYGESALGPHPHPHPHPLRA